MSGVNYSCGACSGPVPALCVVTISGMDIWCNGVGAGWTYTGPDVNGAHKLDFYPGWGVVRCGDDKIARCGTGDGIRRCDSLLFPPWPPSYASRLYRCAWIKYMGAGRLTYQNPPPGTVTPEHWQVYLMIERYQLPNYDYAAAFYVVGSGPYTEWWQSMGCLMITARVPYVKPACDSPVIFDPSLTECSRSPNFDETCSSFSGLPHLYIYEYGAVTVAWES